MLKFPEIEKFFPEFQLDTIEKGDTIKIRLASMVIDHPFYVIKEYDNKDLDFLKSECVKIHSDMCNRIHHFYKGLSKHDPEEARKLSHVEWLK